MAEFIPSYLEIDFLTLVDKFREELKESDVYRDYDFEGANISILIELMSYVGELTTFFTNKIAKNVYLETADVYEAANRLARQIGYEPKGIRSARATVSIAVTGTPAWGPIKPGDTLRVLPWKALNSGRTTDDGDSILFATTASVEVTASGNSIVFDLPIRQGQVIDLENYSGDDLIDNELILPVQYSYDDDLTDVYPTVRVLVSPATATLQTEWERVSDFYLDLIPQVSDNVYMFIYDRYERNKVVFNSSRNVPDNNDRIDIRVLDSLGVDGSIGADVDETWVILDSEFMEIWNPTTSPMPEYVDNNYISISLSASSIGAADPETITEIKFNSASALRAQFRDVTPNDYNSYLSSRSDIIRANAWGEQDLSPSAGNPQEYNLVHLSVIPTVWGNSTISTCQNVHPSDDFTGTDGDLPNTCRWDVREMQDASIQSNKVNFDPSSGFYSDSWFTSLNALQGDFDVILEFDSASFVAPSIRTNYMPYISLWSIDPKGLWEGQSGPDYTRPINPIDSGYAIRGSIGRFQNNINDGYGCVNWTDGVNTSSSTDLLSADASGKLRITRVGSVITAYRWDNGDSSWKWNGSSAGYVIGNWTGDMWFLILQEQETGGTCSGNVDNFTATYDGINRPTSFETDWSLSAATLLPNQYSTAWEAELLNYLAPRKMICAYEIFEVPDLVYFTFEMGVRIKRTFVFTEVAQDLLAKLIYYFRPQNQLFNSEMDFKDVLEFLMDTTEVSTDDEFENIRGIRNIVIRDINSNKLIYEPGSRFGLYPRWVEQPWTNRDNMLRQVQLGLNQFPVLADDAVKMIQEY